jgi:hypothetical protein
MCSGTPQEHEKLLLFYPADTPFDAKMNAVGITEALFKFSRSVSAVDTHRTCCPCAR